MSKYYRRGRKFLPNGKTQLLGDEFVFADHVYEPVSQRREGSRTMSNHNYKHYATVTESELAAELARVKAQLREQIYEAQTWRNTADNMLERTIKAEASEARLLAELQHVVKTLESFGYRVRPEAKSAITAAEERQNQ